MTRQGYKCLCLLLAIAVLQPAMCAEVLQNISDDAVNISIQTEPAEQTERRFSYRVICSPDDEALPDCMPTPTSENSVAKPNMVLPIPDFPPEAADIDSEDQDVVSTPVVERAKPHKKSSKKQAKKAEKKNTKKGTKKRGKN